jgi:predicted lipoprotein with Yx(FWY)xxD motif
MSAIGKGQAMTDLMRRALARGPGRWVAGGTMAVAVAMGGTAMAASPASASAGPVMHHSRSAVVVKKRTRHHFGKILVTTKGRALYVLPHGSCTGGCLSVWPRLVMPKGKTTPKGAMCLGTKKFGSHGRRQVTYRKMRLYTFVDDSGTSVTGNGVSGFKVARVVRCHR